MAKKGLGKGLGALIQPGKLENENVSEVEISKIKPNQFQPRKTFEPEKLAELVNSIREHGVVQPLVVRPKGKGYELIAGERRLRSAKEAGLKVVPVVVRQYDDKQALEIALIENLQREDLNPIEEAEAYLRLMKEFELTQEQIAQRLGKSRPVIANTVRLLNLPGEIRESLEKGQISAGHARAILGLETVEDQLLLWKIVVEQELTVRDTEKMVKDIDKLKKQSVSEPTKKASKQKDVNVIDLEERLKALFSTQVKISQGKKKGKIEIEYYNSEDLDRILDKLMGDI